MTKEERALDIVGYEVEIEFGVPRRIEKFHWRGSEAACRRKAIYKSHYVRVVSTQPINRTQWNRGYGNPAIRETLWNC
jgi:hypothetical protein